MPRPQPLNYRSAFAALALIAGSAFGQSTSPVDLAIDGCGKAHAMRQLFEAGLDPSEHSHRPPGDGDIGPREAMTDTDVLHNALDIEVVPASTFLSGSNTMTIQSFVDGLSTFTFMLGDNYTISDITLNASTTLTAASLGNYARQVTFPTPFNAGDTFTLKIVYSGTPISHGYGSIRFSSHSGVPIVCTLSEPYFSGDWWPAKDGAPGLSGDNSDKATFDIWITAPDNLVTVSNGLLQGVDVLSASRKRYRWQTNYPMASYLACFSTTNYNTWTSTYTYPLPGGGTGSMPAQFFVTPENDSSGLRATWNESLNMMGVFRPLYGEYPFVNEKYGIYEFVFSGGMEHQTMTGQLASTDASLTAHELAHQWWGDNITCRTWNDIWLNEGFATYSQALWGEFRANNPVPARASLGTAPTTSGSVYRYDTSTTGAIFNSGLAYNKGAWVLHGLRHACGSDAAFFSVLAAYRAAYQGHSSTTDSLASVASAVLGRDMQPFFDAWIYGEGAPKFAVSHNVMTLGGKAYMKLRLRQAQASPAAPLFPTPVDIRVIRNAVPATYVVDSDAVSKYFVIPLTGSGPVPPPNLDPDSWILRQPSIVDAWVPGPPVLIASTPAPGITLAPGTPVASISLVFSENITASPANFLISRQGGTMPFTYEYIPANQTATLLLASSLPPGTYTVTTSGPIRANAQDLDGEMTGNTLPSGNGIPGGQLAITFTIPPCPADFDSDGTTDFFDYDSFVSCFEGGPCPAGTTADFDADGSVDFFDYDAFVVAFESPC